MVSYPNNMAYEPPRHPGRTIARLARQVELAVSSLDLTLSQYRVLGILGDGHEAASVLADKLAVSRPSVTGVVVATPPTSVSTKVPLSFCKIAYCGSIKTLVSCFVCIFTFAVNPLLSGASVLSKEIFVRYVITPCVSVCAGAT